MSEYEDRHGKTRHKLAIEIDNLTTAQKIALEDMLAVWVGLGSAGASRWTGFYADGDGNFHPRITIDGRKPEYQTLFPSTKFWTCGEHGEEYRIDFDAIAWKLRDGQ